MTYKRALKKQIKCIEVFFETCPQLFLQLYILYVISGFANDAPGQHDYTRIEDLFNKKEKDILGFEITAKMAVQFSVVTSILNTVKSFISYRKYRKLARGMVSRFRLQKIGVKT